MADYDWSLPRENAGDDETDVIAVYNREITGEYWMPWEDLPEWIRQAWRREYRDA